MRNIKTGIGVMICVLIGYIHIIEKPESQYFRRLLAEKEGYTKEYDYKCNLFLDKGEATYASLVKKYDEERTDSN